MKTLGLIGGMSWVSTIDYYRLINEGVNHRLGGSQYARCVIHSFNFGDIEELNARQDWDAYLELVTDAAEGLVRAGAEGLVLCANTAHVVADRLALRLSIPLIHIADPTASAVERAGVATVALLGTRATMEGTFFIDRLTRRGIRVLVPAPDDRELIHATIFAELGKGILRPETRRRYQEIIGALVAAGADGVVLGCTEIPLLIKPSDCPVPTFDTTALHAEAAVDFALG